MQDVLRYFPGLMAGAHDYLAELGRTARQAFSPGRRQELAAADDLRQDILKLVELERKRAQSNTNRASGEFTGTGA